MLFIGDKLKYLRLRHNITQDELGKRLGITKSAISMLENNKRHPSKTILLMLENQFGLDENFWDINELSFETKDKNINNFTEKAKWDSLKEAFEKIFSDYDLNNLKMINNLIELLITLNTKIKQSNIDADKLIKQIRMAESILNSRIINTEEIQNEKLNFLDSYIKKLEITEEFFKEPESLVKEAISKRGDSKAVDLLNKIIKLEDEYNRFRCSFSASEQEQIINTIISILEASKSKIKNEDKSSII